MKSLSLKVQGQLLLLALAPLLLGSCLAAKMADALAMHKRAISEIAISKAPPTKKLDVVAETYVQVLEEALRYGSAKKAIKHVNTFSKQNEKELDVLLKEIGAWTGNLSTTESLLFAGRLATKPYTRQLIQLIPKFKRKVNRRIQTFSFLSKLTKIVSPESLLEKVMQ